MKRISNYFVVAMLGLCLAATNADASVMSYRMTIDGNTGEDPNAHSFLSVGTHTLLVEAIVTDNALVVPLPGSPFDGGILQTSFSLNTDHDGFTFVDLVGGGVFGGAPDALWDSADTTPAPFDTQFKGQTDLGGGPTIFEETSTISPGNYNAKFQNAGANVWTVVAQGDFEYAGGTHPLHLDLLTALKDVSVADFDGAGIIAVAPDTLNAASIWFIPEPGSLVLASMGLIGIVVGRRRRF